MDLGGPRCVLKLLIAGVHAAYADVVGDRAFEQSGVLIDHGHQGAQGLIADIADIGIVQHYAAAHDVIVARQQIDDRTFSGARSEEHTSELQSLMRISYAVVCLKQNKRMQKKTTEILQTHKTK